MVATGPIFAALEVSFTARIPEGLADDHLHRSAELVEIPIRFRVSVRAGCDRVEVDGELDNRARDHRVRVRFSAGIAATKIVCDGQFSIEERPIADQRESTSSLGVTLLRSVGWLSRGDLKTRNGQAGPMISIPDAQQLGRNRFRFAFRIVPGSPGLNPAECSSNPAFLESITAPASAGQQGMDHQFSLANFDGTDFALTAMKASIRVPGALIICFFNTSRNPGYANRRCLAALRPCHSCSARRVTD